MSDEQPKKDEVPKYFVCPCHKLRYATADEFRTHLQRVRAVIDEALGDGR